MRSLYIVSFILNASGKMHQEQLQQNALISLKEHYNVLNASPFLLPECPTLSFDQRGAIAGSALLGKNHIRLNQALLESYEEYFYKQVIPHELAHLAVYKHFGSVRPHGKEWKMIMTDIFSLPPERCHTLSLTNTNIRQFLYECDCQQVELSVRRHNKVMRKQASYACRSCNTTLKFVKEL